MIQAVIVMLIEVDWVLCQIKLILIDNFQGFVFFKLHDENWETWKTQETQSKVLLLEFLQKGHLAGANRLFQSMRMESAMPTSAMTADCRSWCLSAKWKWDPLLRLFQSLSWAVGHVARKVRLTHTIRMSHRSQSSALSRRHCWHRFQCPQFIKPAISAIIYIHYIKWMRVMQKDPL